MIVRPRNPQHLLAVLKEKPLVLYGFGGAGASIARWCDQHEVSYIFADRDAEEKRKETDKLVISPETLAAEYDGANIVIASIVYYDEIVKSLLALGISRANLLSYQLFMPEQITWKDLEHSTVWGTHMGRVEQIARWIPSKTKSVADYGAGKLSLKGVLEPATVYYPIDYVKRSEETIVCDFDRDELPALPAEVSVCTATLVFIKRAETLLDHLCRYTSQRMILSYVTWDTFSNQEGRRASGYVNDFTQEELCRILSARGFDLREVKADPANKIDTMYLFGKKAALGGTP